MASSYHAQAANNFDSSLHFGWLVGLCTCINSQLVANIEFSVVLVSIVWVIVLSKVGAVDITCTFNPPSAILSHD